MGLASIDNVRAQHSRRIFVQVPSYRDLELEPTLRSLYANAAYPERLRTVVLWQRAPGDRGLGDVSALPGLTIIEVTNESSAGPNWARHTIQELDDGEEYTLMLDSHMRFAKRWDQVVIAMLESLRTRGIAKPLLTAYLPAYAPGTSHRRWRHDPYKIYPLARDDGVLTRLTSYPIHDWRSLEAPVPAEFLSLHFALADGEFNRVVPHDPQMYFFGDEVALGARAYTFGWDMFHPHRVVGWHAYNRSTRVAHWDEHPDWGNAHCRTLARLRMLYSGEPSLTNLLGRTRSITDYERFIMHDLVTPS